MYFKKPEDLRKIIYFLKKENNELENKNQKSHMSIMENDNLRDRINDVLKENDILREKVQESRIQMNDFEKIPKDKRELVGKIKNYEKEMKKKDIAINELRKKLGMPPMEKKKIKKTFADRLRNMF